jgi:hypothetical protein
LSNYRDGLDYSKIPRRRLEAARKIANVLYQLGPSHLFLSEEMALSRDRELVLLVDDCLESLRNGCRWPPYYYGFIQKIILDKPDLRYESIIKEYCALYDFVHIDFLCSGISYTSHFYCTVLAEYQNLRWGCLNIPVSQWHEYKNRPEYKGS